MPSREATPRVSIAQVRGQLAPRVYRAMTTVRLEHGGVVADVALVTVPAHGSVKAPQRRLACPRCARAVLVLGAVGDGWCCAGCGRWRSRVRSRSASLGAVLAVDELVSAAPTRPPLPAPACGSARRR